MKRAPKGLGSVSLLQNGRWLVKVPVGKTAQGATRYKSKVLGTKSEAKRWQNKFIALREQQQLIAGPRLTLKDYAAEVLLTPSDRVRARTLDGYYRNLRNHVLNRLGNKTLADIQTRDVEALLKELRRTLSASTVNNVRIALSKVFSIADRHGLVLVNPVSKTDKAKRGEFEKTNVRLPWSVEEAQRALACASGHDLELFITLGLSTGMRRGEMLGLQWKDIDFEAGTVSIERSIHRESIIQIDGSRHSEIVITPPKTAKSRRVNNLTLPVLDLLHRYRLEQEIAFSQREPKPQFIFTNRNGDPLDESKLSYRYRKFLKENGLRYIRIHDLRHTFATILITDDAKNIAAASKALGHSSLAITLDVYGKTAQVETQATKRIGELLYPDRERILISPSVELPIQGLAANWYKSAG